MIGKFSFWTGFYALLTIECRNVPERLPAHDGKVKAMITEDTSEKTNLG